MKGKDKEFSQLKKPVNLLKEETFISYRLGEENQKYFFGHKCMAMNQPLQWHCLMCLTFSMQMMACTILKKQYWTISLFILCQWLILMAQKCINVEIFLRS